MSDRMDLIFISPHLDDAVFSCPGTILSAAAAGKRVLVATVFSTGGADEGSQEQYARRHAEDRLALKTLGAEPLFLGFIDAPFRDRSNDWSFDWLHMRADLTGEDRSILPALVERIQALCDERQPQCIYLPLALGNHVDHRLVHEVAWQLKTEAQILFYEDRPYAFLKHSLLLRLHALGAFSSQLAPFPALSVRRQIQVLFEHLQSMRRVEFYREGIFRRKRRLFRPRSLRKFFFLPPLARHPVKLDRVIRRWPELPGAALKAISAYETQLCLWQDPERAWINWTREQAREMGFADSYVECFWNLSG